MLDVVWLLTFGRSHPDLVRERLRPGPGAKEGFLGTLVLYGLPYFGHYLLAALDLGRFHWFRPVPLRLQLAGLIGYFGALGVAMWATAVNPFFSSALRIQSERGQHVITTGPYRFVRHPGYAAAIPLLISSALALGSWAAAPVHSRSDRVEALGGQLEIVSRPAVGTRLIAVLPAREHVLA